MRICIVTATRTILIVPVTAFPIPSSLPLFALSFAMFSFLALLAVFSFLTLLPFFALLVVFTSPISLTLVLDRIGYHGDALLFVLLYKAARLNSSLLPRTLIHNIYIRGLFATAGVHSAYFTCIFNFCGAGMLFIPLSSPLGFERGETFLSTRFIILRVVALTLLDLSKVGMLECLPCR